MGESKSRLYIDSLDGIRACAVLLVFIAHAGFTELVPGGFGVTVFFFLSGFLITTLLRVEMEKTENISFKAFYIRRVYRIFPPLYIVLLLAIFLAIFDILPNKMEVSAVVAQILHFTNYYTVIWGKEGLAPGTSAMWSLSVEEHFYLIFPFLYLYLIKRGSYKKMALVLLALCLLVLLWRCYLVFGLDIGRPYTYKATDARIDSIMYGCIMGVWLNPVLDSKVKISFRVEVSALCLALGVLLICFLYRDPAFRQTLRYSLQGLALFPMFYLAVKRSSWPIFSWLNWKYIRVLGVISYTFYLTHMIFLQLGSVLFPDSIVAKVVMGFLFTLIFSLLMYHFVEKKFAEMRRKLHSENAV